VHLDSGPPTAVPGHVNCPLVVTSEAHEPSLQESTIEKNVSDSCEQKNGSQSESVDVSSTKSVNIRSTRSDQGSLKSDGKLESSATELVEAVCEPAPQIDDVAKSSVATANCVHASPPISEFPVPCSSAVDSPVVYLHGGQSQRSSESTGLSKAELVNTKNCSTEMIVGADDSGPFVRSTAVSAPSDVSVRSVRKDSVTEIGAGDLLSPKNVTIEISPIEGQRCETNECLVKASVLTVDAQNSPIQFKSPARQDSVTETGGCTFPSPQKTAVEMSPVKAQCFETDECSITSVQVSEFMVNAQDPPIHSEWQVSRRESVTETGGSTMSSPRNNTVEISPVKAQHSGTDECPVKVPGLVDNAQNSHIHSGRPVSRLESVTETGGCTISGPQNTAVEISSQCCETEGCLVEVSELMVSAKNSPIYSEKPASQRESVKEIDGCTTSSRQNTAAEISSVKAQCSETDECPVEISELMVNAQNSPIHSGRPVSLLKSEAEAGGCTMLSHKNTTVEISPVKAQRSETVKISELMVSAKNSPIYSEKPASQRESVKEIDGCTTSSPQNTAAEISSVKAQCSETDECPVEISELMVNTKNSPIHSGRPVSRLESEREAGGCTMSSPKNTTVEISPVKAQYSETDVQLSASSGDTQPMETVDCLVQTSTHFIDHSCSPLPCVVTHNVGSSPLKVETRTASTSPIKFLQTVGRSMMTDPWMIDISCSPMTLPPHCEGFCVASAQTSPQHCSTKSTKYNTASFSTDRPQSQRTTDNTSPGGFRQNSSIPACGEEFCQILSGAVSDIASESSYVSACNCDEEVPPQQVAAAGRLESFKGSTQPHSCDELFDDNSQLSETSPRNVAHQPSGIYPSQLPLPLQSSAETRNSDTQPAELEDPVSHKLLNLDDSYSLESSQVFPKCSDGEKSEEVEIHQSEDKRHPAAF